MLNRACDIPKSRTVKRPALYAVRHGTRLAAGATQDVVEAHSRPLMCAVAIAIACMLVGSGCSNDSQAGPSAAPAPQRLQAVSQPSVPAPTPDRAPAGKPHVILVLIDTLRADHLGFMGYKRATSPTLDAWAAESVVFDRAYAAAPWTVPSVASLFTSLYPSVHHVLDRNGNYPAPGLPVLGDILPDEVETIAEAFAAAGYQTAAFVANPYVEADTKFNQGFRTFQHYPEKSPYAAASKVLADAAQWLANRDAEKPVFLYVHLMDTHQPYNAPRKFRDPFVAQVKQLTTRTPIAPVPDNFGHLQRIMGNTEHISPDLKEFAEYWIARYDAGIAHVDDELRQFRVTLEKGGLWDNAILLVTADHGESLYDQGGWDHGYSPFEHELHVPLMFHAPKRWPARRVPTTIGLIDIKPTLLELAGVTTKEWMQGNSFAALLSGPIAADPGFAFAEGVKKADTLKAACRGNHKIICDVKAGRSAYFDLTRDPKERARLPVPEGNSDAATLKSRLDSVLAENRANEGRLPNRQTPRAAALQAKLKAIGYLGGAGKPAAGAQPPYGSFQFDPK